MKRIAEQASELPGARHVCIGDRESDILVLLVMARKMDHAADYLVRCQHNRVLPEGGKLWDEAMAGAPLGHIRFEMPAGRGRKARAVEQELRAQRVVLPDRQGGQLEVTCFNRLGGECPGRRQASGLAPADQPGGTHAAGCSGARQLVPRAVGN